MKKFIPVAEPALVGNEKEYVMECMDSTWISSSGKYVDRFEKEFASFCDVGHAVSCCNGTVAIHIALMALGLEPGDEVIVPTLTFTSTANAVAYCGAKPVFVDSEDKTWNMDPGLIEPLVTDKTKGIIVVHLYGHPVNMDPVMEIAKKRGLFVIEDAAEAHGARYKDKVVGSMGEMSTFSFYGNKILTTGEGGMVVTNDEALASNARQLKGQGMDPKRRYWFPVLGYNYRMTNVAAAIGVAQLEKVDWHLERRREVADQYAKRLGDLSGLTLQPQMSWATNVYWMNSILLDERLVEHKDAIRKKLADDGIETRPFFHPLHTLPMYSEANRGLEFPVAEKIATAGFSIPSSATLSAEDVSSVCDKVEEAIGVFGK